MQYDKEFKLQALELSDEIGVKAAAHQLGIKYYTLADWRRQRKARGEEAFIRTADKYVDIEEIDPCMLRELIKAVYVEAPDKSSGKRKQRVHIEYDLVGYIPVDELIKAEQA